jgi:DNA-binding protein H-NS
LIFRINIKYKILAAYLNTGYDNIGSQFQIGNKMSEYQQLLSQISELQAKATSIREIERKLAIEQIRSLMTVFTIKPSDLVQETQTKSKNKEQASNFKKAPVKYCDSNGNQWSGRGLQPKWLREALASGNKLDSFLVKPD